MDPVYTPDEMKQMLTEVYADRNRLAHLCAALALNAGLTAGVGVDPDEPDWPVIYTQLPAGQVGWHVPLDELLPGLPLFDSRWDGHTNEEKADRIRRYVAREP